MATDKQVEAVNFMITDYMQYFRLPPRRQRIASQLDRWADEAIGVFFKEGEKDGECNRRNG